MVDTPSDRSDEILDLTGGFARATAYAMAAFRSIADHLPADAAPIAPPRPLMLICRVADAIWSEPSDPQPPRDELVDLSNSVADFFDAFYDLAEQLARRHQIEIPASRPAAGEICRVS